MSSFIHDVAKRAVVAAAVYRPGKAVGDQPFEQLPPYAVASLIFTGFLFMMALGLISYTYNQVVATLAIVESPVAFVFESVPSDDADDVIDKKGPKADLVVTKQAPITSSIYGTVRYLRQEGGYASRFRGASVQVIYAVLLSQLVLIFPRVFPRPLATIVSCIVLSSLDLTWTHIVITKTSRKFWFRRLASLDISKKIILPAAIVASIEQVVMALNVSLWRGLGLYKLQHAQYLSGLTQEELKVVALKLLLALVINLLSLGVFIPTNVVLRRVQASLLPEDQETIVPFDRTFGGKISGGMIGVLDSWLTFDWNSRVRIIKIYLKVIGMQLAVSIFFAIAVLAELRLFLGNDFEMISHIFDAGEAKLLDVIHS